MLLSLWQNTNNSKFLLSMILILWTMQSVSFATDTSEYGPTNPLTAFPTPFNSPKLPNSTDSINSQSLETITSGKTDIENISLSKDSGHSIVSKRLGNLSRKLVSSRIYLPGKMIIGKNSEFIVKGPPGAKVAIAMADKDSGAKAIQGINLRLGADRKLVALGQIPEKGVLSLNILMPIQGDLIGLPVFFEAVVWQNPDFSDLELAIPVKSQDEDLINDKANAVIVDANREIKRGIQIVPDSAIPLHQRNSAGIGSGRP